MADWTGVKSNYSLNKLGAYHMIGDDDYEPQRNNNFELRIYELNNLFTVDSRIKIPADIAENTITLSTVTVGAISTNVGVLPVAYGNTKVKFAGLPEVSDLEATFNDYIGKSTERILAAWHALVFDPKRETIGRASVYKKPGLLIETAPDGTHGRAWKLFGCWPSNLNYGGYDYNGGNTRQISLTITCDRAIPLDD